MVEPDETTQTETAEPAETRPSAGGSLFDVEAPAEDEKPEKVLLSGTTRAIFLGNYATHHPDASQIEALAATSEIEAALLEATRRLVAGDDTAFEEQQRLHASREAMNERLANLASNE